MAGEVGRASVVVTADIGTFTQSLRQDLRRAGQEAGRAFDEALQRSVRNAGRDAGRTVTRDLQRALRGVTATVTVNPDTSRFRNELTRQLRGLAAVSVRVSPDTSTFQPSDNPSADGASADEWLTLAVNLEPEGTVPANQR